MQTKRTIIKPFSVKQGMRNSENLQITFLISSEVSEKKFGRIFATVRESPPYLIIRSQPPTLHQIYRVTKQVQTRSCTKNREQKSRSANPCITYPKRNKTKKEDKNDTLYAFFMFIKAHTQKKNLLLIFHKWPARAAKMTH